MRVRCTTTAADDLAHIVEYIGKDNPAAARRVAQTIYLSIARSGRFPQSGRIGLAEDTRELVCVPWPYVAVYEIIHGAVQVLRIRHAAQDWP